MNSFEKNARIVWRTKSVDVTRVMPEPVRGLGRDGRLAGAGRAADEDDDREVELLELAEAAEAVERT